MTAHSDSSDSSDSSEDSSSDDDASSSTDRYSVTAGSVEDLDSYKVKSWTVQMSKDEEIAGVKLELPGRAFISYISDSSGPLAYVNVTGDSENLVSKVKVESDGSKTLWVGIDSAQHSGLSGDLLTEVFLTTSNAVKAIVSTYSGSVVVQDNVLDSTSVELTAVEQSSVFIDAEDAGVNLTAMHVTVKNKASLQVDVSSVDISTEADFGAYVSGTINLFASSFSAKYLHLVASDNGQICFNSDDIDVEQLEGHQSSKISFPNAAKSYDGASGSFSCTKTSVPSRTVSSVTSTSTSSAGSSESLVGSASSMSGSSASSLGKVHTINAVLTGLLVALGVVAL